MHNKSGRFVDHKYGFVLIYNIQWNVLGYDLNFIAWTVHYYLYDIQWFDTVV